MTNKPLDEVIADELADTITRNKSHKDNSGNRGWRQGLEVILSGALLAAVLIGIGSYYMVKKYFDEEDSAITYRIEAAQASDTLKRRVSELCVSFDSATNLYLNDFENEVSVDYPGSDTSSAYRSNPVDISEDEIDSLIQRLKNSTASRVYVLERDAIEAMEANGKLGRLAWLFSNGGSYPQIDGFIDFVTVGGTYTSKEKIYDVLRSSQVIEINGPIGKDAQTPNAAFVIDGEVYVLTYRDDTLLYHQVFPEILELL